MRHSGIDHHRRIQPFLLSVLLLLPLSAHAQMQINVTPDGHETAIGVCRPATPEEARDPRVSPDGWVQDGPRESFTRGTVPLPLVPNWVGTRIRATGVLLWGDADGDSDPDLFVGTYWANQWPPLVDYYNFLYLNHGGTLEANPSWISSDEKHTSDAGWARINNDAYPDLFCANGGSSLQPSQVFYGRDGLLPTTAGWQNTGGTWTTGASLADFDLDGDIDVATSNQGISPNPYRPTYVYRNTGAGLETSPWWQSNQVGITSDCDWGDMNGDGRPDLAVSGWVGWETGVFRNLGNTLDPGFAWTTGHPERTDKGVGWARADHDSVPDLAVGGNGGPDWLFRNEGTVLGASPVWASNEAYTGCQDLTWVDVDRDGDQDLAMIHFSTGHARIYLNNDGVLSTTADWQYDAASSGTAIAFGDVNGDGWPDLAVGMANGPIELFLNQQLPAGVEQSAADLPSGGAISILTGPNPFSDRLTVTLESGSPIGVSSVALYDVSGRWVADLKAPSSLPAYARMATWSVTNLGTGMRPGVYVVRASLIDSDGVTKGISAKVVHFGR